ncbi:MAG: PilN domain-containing protein [Planctomycetes bacterium]|nr:PilN domain-containing protein [Planctomycetota bacterium]
MMGDVNLIPAGRLIARRRRTRLFLWATICGMYALLLGAGALTFRVVRADEERSTAEQLDSLAGQIEQDNRAMVDLRRQLAETNTALDAAQALHDRADWSKLLTGLSAQLGDEIVLSRCQLTTLTADNKVVNADAGGTLAALPLGAFLTECRHLMVLHGFGKSQESVSQFVLRLEGSGAFDLVRLMNRSRQTFLTGEAVAFVVECRF